jgi:hypothetical protein
MADFTAATNARPRPTSSTAKIARLISELVDATTDADPAWRDQVLGLIRLALDLKRDER